MKIGDEVEVRPGIIEVKPNQEVSCKPIQTRVVSLKADEN